MPKKNIKDLIKKKQTKKAEEDQQESAGKEVEDTTQQNQADQTNKDKASPMPKAKRIDDSDDESEDDADIQTNSQLYGMITENKDDKQEETKIEGYGLEDKDQQNGPKVDSQVSKPPRISKNTASNISFQRAGPPRFSRGAQKTGGNTKVGDFDVGLDDIDDAGNIKKVKKNTKTEQSSNTNANSGPAQGGNQGYDFRSLGSSAQASGPRRNEEEKSNRDIFKSSAPMTRPRFTGKLNLQKTGDGDEKVENTGVTTSYGFSVKYKTEHPDGPRKDFKDRKQDGEEGTEATGDQPEVRKDRRNVHRDNDKRRDVNREEDSDDEAKDEGFEVVKDKDAERRQQRRVNKYKPESGSDKEDEDQFTVTKPTRVVQNRGGAFANMS